MSNLLDNQDNIGSEPVVVQDAPVAAPEETTPAPEAVEPVAEPTPEPVVEFTPAPVVEPVVEPTPEPVKVQEPVSGDIRIIFSKKSIGTEIKKGYNKVSESKAKELMSRYNFVRFARDEEIRNYPF